MNRAHGNSNSSQRGVALLISIFALLLISGVAITMITMSSTESALNANYRRNTGAYLAAKSGIEEARNRLVPCAPDTLWPNTACANPPVSNDPLFSFNPPSVPGISLYIVNTAATDAAPVNPINPADPYYDFQYAMEFGQAGLALQALSRVVQTSNLVPGQIAGLPPMHYKWVRINLKSEAMGGIDLNGDGAAAEQTLPLRAQSSDNQCITGQANCTADPNATITTAPVYRVTAMAVDPTGAERVVQAEVAMPPIFNPNGAISSEAGVDINGNFNAFGAWPPLVNTTCGSGKAGVPKTTCGSYDGKQMLADCSNIYDAATDTCNGVPRKHTDYCGQGSAVNGVSSKGAVNAKSYEKAPDGGVGCDTLGNDCIFTASPQKGVSANTPDWPYNMEEIINQFRPPVSEPLQQVDKNANCDPPDTNGNSVCRGSGLKLGQLPSPFPVPPGVTSTNEVPKITFASTGPGGELKLTAGTSGAGVLVVEGDLEITGGFSWYGLIIVRGVVKFAGGGSDPKNIIGGIIAGSSVTNSTAFTDVGGSVNVTYSSCAFRKSSSEQPLRYLGFREIVRPRPANP